MADADMEVKPQTIFSGFGDLPELGHVIAHEVTDYGWRGLTQDGEVFEVKSLNGHKAAVPEGEIIVQCNGRAIGRRAIVHPPAQIDIDRYLEEFNRAVDCYKGNNLVDALAASHAAVNIAPTLRAKFNRAMILLASGQWQEGLAEYEQCEEFEPFMRPPVREALDAGLQPWRGEDLNGKRILVIHAHGFGDTLMCLRYVRHLILMGADVVMSVPAELARLASQWGEVSANSIRFIECDYFVPFLHLLRRLQVEPINDVDGKYLTVPQHLVDKWRDRLGPATCRRVGVAWSVGKPSTGDYPRTIEPEVLIDHFGLGVALHSMQAQQSVHAEIIHHEFESFSDCAALMLCMDEIVTVDTAAVHLAGAIGHPNVKLLLSYWASWRWRKPWYNHIKICRQTSAGDWASALEQC